MSKKLTLNLKQVVSIKGPSFSPFFSVKLGEKAKLAGFLFVCSAPPVAAAETQYGQGSSQSAKGCTRRTKMLRTEAVFHRFKSAFQG